MDDRLIYVMCYQAMQSTDQICQTASYTLITPIRSSIYQYIYQMCKGMCKSVPRYSRRSMLSVVIYALSMDGMVVVSCCLVDGCGVEWSGGDGDGMGWDEVEWSGG